MAENEEVREDEQEDDLLQGQEELERSSVVQETHAQRGLMAAIAGVVVGGIGGLIVYYGGGGMFSGLGWVMVAAGAVGLVFGIISFFMVKKVEEHDITCPFCDSKNYFTHKVDRDVRCFSCLRQIPVRDGEVMEVFQVQCGFCQHLNFYSDKSAALICEECDRIIPIATDEEGESSEVLERFTAREADDTPYDLTLEDAGPKREEIIPVLQKMLALNRNQVKDIVDEAPSLLLTGIAKKKAELLKVQIEMHGGKALVEPSQG